MSLVASARVVCLPVSFLGGACIYRLQKKHINVSWVCWNIRRVLFDIDTLCCRGKVAKWDKKGGVGFIGRMDRWTLAGWNENFFVISC